MGVRRIAKPIGGDLLARPSEMYTRQALYDSSMKTVPRPLCHLVPGLATTARQPPLPRRASHILPHRGPRSIPYPLSPANNFSSFEMNYLTKCSIKERNAPGPPNGIPRPAGTPLPGPAIKPVLSSPSTGGGPSTVTDTIVSPRRITRPSVRFCCTVGAASVIVAPFAFLPLHVSWTFGLWMWAVFSVCGMDMMG